MHPSGGNWLLSPTEPLYSQGKQARVLAPGSGSRLPLSTCSQPSPLASATGQRAGEGRRTPFRFVSFCSFTEAILEKLSFSHWTKMPLLLLAATLWPGGQAALKRGRLGQRQGAGVEEKLLGHSTELLTKLC